MFSKSFTLACIASVAFCDDHTQDKIAEAAGSFLAQTKSQVQTMGLSQILAKAATKKDAAVHNHDSSEIGLPDHGDGLLLAQIAANQSEINCQTAQNRNKQTPVDFYGILNGNSVFNDSDFGPENNSLYWKDLGEDMSSKADRITWTRASEAFPSTSLFGPDGVHPNDIEQGQLGNCWFLAAAATMAQVPGSVEQMFLNDDVNANGIYAVNFYALGMPITVVVDDFLPLNQYGNTYFAGLGEDAVAGEAGSLWVPIIEKAFAKYHGNYEHIVGGDVRAAVRTMSNSPMDIRNHRQGEETQNDLWDLVKKHTDEGHILAAGTPGNNDSYVNADGLVQGHAYNVLSVMQLSNGDKVVKMQNPWGSEKFTGRYSDDSSLWTAALRSEAGQSTRNDGVFFMHFDDYWNQCSETYISYDVRGWSSDAYLYLDDNSQAQNPGSYSWCGAECTRHSLTLTSDVAQTVHVTGHTWDDRCMADECEQEWQGQDVHSIYAPGQRYVWTFGYGATELEPFDMAAGESITITTEWNFSDERKAKDWSVTAWGENGSVSLSMGNRPSDSMPTITRDNSQGGGDNNDDPADDENNDDPADDDNNDDPADDDNNDDPADDDNNDDPADDDVVDDDEDVVDDEDDVVDDDEDEFDWDAYSQGLQEFRDHVNGQTVTPWDGVGCGVGIWNTRHYTDNYEYFMRTTVKNTCTWVNLVITIYQSLDDFINTDYFYYELDENWDFSADTIIRSCEMDADREDIVGCTFVVGTVDPEEYMVSEAFQGTAAFQNGVGDVGFIDFDYEWEYV